MVDDGPCVVIGIMHFELPLLPSGQANPFVVNILTAHFIRSVLASEHGLVDVWPDHAGAKRDDDFKVLLEFILDLVALHVELSRRSELLRDVV